MARINKPKGLIESGPGGFPVSAGQSWYVFAGGRFNPGNVSSGTVTVQGAEVGDLVVMWADTKGSTPRYPTESYAGKNKFTYSLSGAASTDHTFAWVLFKKIRRTSATRRVY